MRFVKPPLISALRSTINTETVPQMSWRKIRSFSGFIVIVIYAVTSRRLQECQTLNGVHQSLLAVWRGWPVGLQKGHEDLQPNRHLKRMQPFRSPLPLRQTLNCCTVFFIYRLNNPVSVTRGQRLNRVTSLIYWSQPIWTRWDYGRFYELFCNHSTKTTFFQTYFLTLSQINSKNYHFHTFSGLKSTKWNPNESYAGVEINTGPLAHGQWISCWASSICFALARLASKILKPYSWVYMVPVRKFYKYSLWKGYGILKDMLRKNISWGILENPQESYCRILVSLRNPEVHMPTLTKI